MSMYDPGGEYPLWGEIVPLRAPIDVEGFPLMDPSEGPSQADVEEYQAMVRKYARELDALRGPRQW